MNSSWKTVLWCGAPLILIAAGTAWLAHQMPSEARSGVGATFVAIGLVNVVWHRRLGRQVYSWNKWGVPWASGVWVVGVPYVL